MVPILGNSPKTGNEGNQEKIEITKEKKEITKEKLQEKIKQNKKKEIINHSREQNATLKNEIQDSLAEIDNSKIHSEVETDDSKIDNSNTGINIGGKELDEETW